MRVGAKGATAYLLAVSWCVLAGVVVSWFSSVSHSLLLAVVGCLLLLVLSDLRVSGDDAVVVVVIVVVGYCRPEPGLPYAPLRVVPR